MSSPPRAPRSYLIVGAGTFGTATALSLKKLEPDSDVTVLDQTPFPCPMGAGHDYNKIVRADYDDLLYMKLGLKSMESWNSDPLYSTHFHKTRLPLERECDSSQACNGHLEQLARRRENQHLFDRSIGCETYVQWHFPGIRLVQDHKMYDVPGSRLG